MRRLDLGIYENIIEVTWIFDDLIKKRKIKSWDELIDELPTGSDAIKGTIMQIAEDFEKEYDIDDWNETDMEYLSEITKYAKKRLIEEYGSGNSTIKVGDTVKIISKTHYSDGTEEEHIPIGTVCTVKEITYDEKNGTPYYSLLPAKEADRGLYFCYLENELEKGHNENMISADKLIETFTDMANRGTLLCGRDVAQEDLLIQIIGTIVKVLMDL